MSKPHSQKPIPSTMFENFRLKARHILIFDLLCRNFDWDADGSLYCNSLEIKKAMKDFRGVQLETPTSCLNVLERYEYLEFECNPQSHRDQEERRNCLTKYRIRISDVAWSNKTKPAHPNYNKNRNRGAERKFKQASSLVNFTSLD